MLQRVSALAQKSLRANVSFNCIAPLGLILSPLWGCATQLIFGRADNKGTMSFSQFFTILRARWVSALLVFLTLVTTTVVVSLLLPKNYSATASVLVDIKNPDPVAGVMMNAMMAPGYMATQVDLIQSERVGRKAIAALGLTQNPQLRQDWQEATEGVGDFEAWLVTALAKKLDIKPSRESTVVTISYTSQDPRFSAAIANAYVKGYVDTTLELKTEPARQFNTFFDDRATKMREAVEAAQTRLSEFQRSRGIINNDERLDVETMRLQELTSQIVAMEAAAMESAGRLGQAAATPDRMQEVLNNPVVAQLQSDLARQETKLEELVSRLGEANPQVVETRASVGSLRSKLQAATSRASGSVGVTNNVAQQRLAQLRVAREDQRAKVLKIKASRDEVNVFQRDVENAQRAYDAVVQRANQTSLESQVTQTNVSVVKEATPPPEPSSPKLLLNTALAVFLGTLLATATALLRELMDPRVRSADDITVGLKVPLMMVLPKPVNEKVRLSASNHKALQRISGSRTPTALSAS